MNKTTTITAIAVAAILGASLGWWTSGALPGEKGSGSAGSGEGEGEREREILYWVAPMDPNYRRDKPGKSPMGMDLEPVYADEAAVADEGQPSLRISPAVVNNIGVKTAPAERGTLHRRIETIGFIAPDAERIEHIHVRTEGWIEELAAETEGDRVEAGQLLFRIYSPALVSAQDEYLQGLRTGQSTLLRAAASRLRALGMRTDQIESLKDRGKARQLFDVRAPIGGYVMELNVRQGMFVQPGTTIMSLADLSTVWVDVDVFENQIDWVETGQTAYMKLSFAPEREWQGVVDYIYPTIRPESRTARVRLAFDNPDLVLKPDMYAKVVIDGAPQRDVVHVPSQAVIRANGTERVILALGEGRFRPVQVRTGLESEGRVEILEGLAESEKIVISSQFLIDSEASMDASLLRMIGQGQNGTGQSSDGMETMDHSNDDMDGMEQSGHEVESAMQPDSRAHPAEAAEHDGSGDSHEHSTMDDGGESP